MPNPKLKIIIDENGCRGCELCVEECCIMNVLEMKKIKDNSGRERAIAWVKEPDNCIECLSCVYRCPANVITLENYRPVKNFYSVSYFSQKWGKFV